MAVFEANSRRKPGTASNTKLFISGGNSPAEHWVVDKSLPILFSYDYGGPGQKEVVISKGMAVSIKQDPEVDYETGKKKGVLTVAGSANSTLVGLAPYNLIKHNDDFLDGNLPSIITREYIELPYIPNAADAADVKWGAVHGAGLKNGDLVTYSRDTQNLGKLIKWVEGTHSFADILGQVLAMEIDQEPWGWLKWALWDETARRDDLGPVNKSGYSAPVNDVGYPYDPSFVDGTIDKDGYINPYTTNPTGIPGLLDGSAKAQTPQSATASVPVGTYNAGSPFLTNLLLKNVIEGSVSATLDGVALAPSEFDVDYKNGIFYTKKNVTGSAKPLIVSFRAAFYGTPHGWDYKGAAGAVRILLKR